MMADTFLRAGGAGGGVVVIEEDNQFGEYNLSGIWIHKFPVHRCLQFDTLDPPSG